MKQWAKLTALIFATDVALGLVVRVGVDAILAASAVPPLDDLEPAVVELEDPPLSLATAQQLLDEIQSRFVPGVKWVLEV